MDIDRRLARGSGSETTQYLTVAPVVSVLPRTLTAKRTGKLRFKLSKISRISVKVTRGTKTLLWTAPKKTGAYSMTVTATDLAGNTASATGEVTVKRRT